MNKDFFRQMSLVVVVIVMIAVYVLSNALPLNGLTAGENSDGFDVYFLPAGSLTPIWLKERVIDLAAGLPTY